MVAPGYDRQMTSETDNLFAAASPNLVDFAFDQRVVNVFPDMIRRSVPAYETVVPLSALVAAQSIPAQQTDPLVYDLGCSRGATTAALLSYCPETTRVVGVDNSAPMIEAARDGIAGLAGASAAQRVEWRCENIQSTEIRLASAVVMNYTLQFIPPAERESQLARIFDGLRPGAPFVYAEKVLLDDPQEQEWADGIHLSFKRANGYSELEVAQKRSSIEKVMIPDSVSQHLSRLRRVGFVRAGAWFSCLNWAAFIGFAPGSSSGPP